MLSTMAADVWSDIKVKKRPEVRAEVYWALNLRVSHMASLAHETHRSRWLTRRGLFWSFYALLSTAHMPAPSSSSFLSSRRRQCVSLLRVAFFLLWPYVSFVVVHISWSINMIINNIWVEKKMFFSIVGYVCKIFNIVWTCGKLRGKNVWEKIVSWRIFFSLYPSLHLSALKSW